MWDLRSVWTTKILLSGLDLMVLGHRICYSGTYAAVKKWDKFVRKPVTSQMYSLSFDHYYKYSHFLLHLQHCDMSADWTIDNFTSNVEGGCLHLMLCPCCERTLSHTVINRYGSSVKPACHFKWSIIQNMINSWINMFHTVCGVTMRMPGLSYKVGRWWW